MANLPDPASMTGGGVTEGQFKEKLTDFINYVGDLPTDTDVATAKQEAIEHADSQKSETDQSIQNLVSTNQGLGVAITNEVNRATTREDTLEMTINQNKSYVDSALLSFQNGAIKTYPTLAAANADIANIALNTKVSVLSAEDGGDYYKATADATSLTKSAYDPVVQSKGYTNIKIDALNIDAFKDDAGIHARTHFELIKNNITDSERIESLLSKGGNVGFKSGDLLFEGKTYASLNNLTNLSFSRTSVAYALNASGKYSKFNANEFRNIIGKGLFLEKESTNQITSVDLTTSSYIKNNITISSTANAAPTSEHPKFTISESVTSTSGQASFTYPKSLAAGSYVFSFVVSKEQNRYLMLLVSISGSSYAAVLDFDADGGPVIRDSTGALKLTSYGIEKLNSTEYRIYFGITTSVLASVNWVVMGCGGIAFSTRNYATTAGNKLVSISLPQLESGLTPTSPIPSANTTRSADYCALAWSGTNQEDQVIVAYDSKKTVLKRSQLTVSTEVNLINDVPLSLGNFISSIYLFPARDPAFYANYDDVDSRSSALAIQDKTLLTAINILFAKAGMGKLNLNYSAALSDVTITDNGCVPYLRIDRTNQKFYWNGQFYKSETALLTESGGVNVSGRITWSAQAISDLDLLGGVTFSSGVEDFTNVSNGSVAAVGGELEFTSTASTGVFSRALRGYGGRALKLSAKYRKGTAAGGRIGASNYSSSLLFNDSPASTTNAMLSMFFSPVQGRQFWIGGGQNGGGLGTSYFDDFKLQEVRPCVNFPNGNYTAVIEAVAPATLPVSGEQVLFQLDCVNTNNRAYISIDNTGLVKFTSRYYGTTGGVDYSSKGIVNLGTVAAGASLKIAIAVSASQVKAAMNGAGSTYDVVGAVGGAYLRIGSSSTTGEEWLGTISNISIYSGSETLQWLINKTSTSTVIPLYKKTNMNILTVGDSFSEFSSTGFSTMLADLGYNVYSVGVGGSTMAEQKTYALAEPDLLKNSLIIWWDGVPNGHTEGQIDIEKGLLQDVLTAAGHTNFIWCRNGQTTVSNTSRDDMKNFMNWIAQTYGATHVYDPIEMYKKLAIQDPTNSGYAADQSALTNESIPPSIKMDTTHLTTTARRAIVKDIQRHINDVFSF